MKKVFISQSMRGRNSEEIQSERDMLIAEAQKVIGEEAEVLDSFFKDFDGNALAFLGKAIGVLSNADVAVFGRGWQDARGCVIEHACCKEYGITTIEF
ncbi:MAG: hypothetical protein LBL05_05185 [Synergistaceae bacterium]|jgi:hypothetical protein|nr:hypothetical protein [Synergistaceae bacterium]